MHIINSISQYINNGDISLDPTRQNNNKSAKFKRLVSVLAAGSLGLLLSPTSVIIGPGLGIYYYAISLLENIQCYLNNKQERLMPLLFKIGCLTIIETPIVITASTIALFFDILTAFIHELTHDEIVFLNLHFTYDALDNLTNRYWSQ